MPRARASIAARREPLMPHARFNRSAWFCPNGHPDWQRPSAEQIAEQGDNLELECGDCGARWKADADQRAILRRYHEDKTRKPPADLGASKI